MMRMMTRMLVSVVFLNDFLGNFDTFLCFCKCSAGGKFGIFEFVELWVTVFLYYLFL